MNRLSRHLKAVEANTAAREASTKAFLELTEPPLPPQLRLLLAQCDKFLAGLEHAEANCEPIRTALLLGQARVHLERMTDLVHVLLREPR